MLVKVRPPRTIQISERQFEKERNCGGQLGNLLYCCILAAFTKYEIEVLLHRRLETRIRTNVTR